MFKKAKRFLAGFCVALMVLESVYVDGLTVNATENFEVFAEEQMADRAEATDAEEAVTPEESVSSDGAESSAESEVPDETKEGDISENDITEPSEEEELFGEGTAIATLGAEEEQLGPDSERVTVVPDSQGGMNVYIDGNTAPFGYVDAEGVFTIESNWTNVPGVTTTDPGVFEGWDKITALKFEQGAAENFIGMKAFKGCVNLETVDLSNCSSLTQIDASAFEGCTKLSSVTFNEGLHYIYKNAFKGCTSLPGIVIKSGLLNLAESAFEGCSNLTSVRIEAANMTCKTQTGSIANKIFYGCQIKNFELAYELSDEVKNIIVPSGLFKGASFAEDVTITIPSNIQEIGESAFESSNLETIVFQDDDAHPSALSTIGKNAFKACESLGEVTFPSMVQNISEGAFQDCTSLGELVLPNSVTKLEKNAFKGCVGIKDLTISNAVPKEKMGASIFEGCTGLTSVVIPSGLTYIGESMFKNCKALQTIEVAGSVNEIGKSAFEGCIVLESFAFPAGITVVNEKTFYGCTKLATAKLPEGVSTVGVSAFEDCISLKSNVLPESLESIGNKAFKNCQSFQSLRIPSNVSSIGQEAFSSCINLGTLTIGSLKITACGNGIFFQCLLREVVFPENITTIPAKLFDQATFTTGVTVTIPNTVTTIGDYAFGGTNTSANAVNVSKIVFEEGSKLETIGKGAFQYCTALDSFTIPETTKTIGQSAFYSCIKLPSIVIPESVTSIGKQAFADCEILSYITYNAVAVEKIDGFSSSSKKETDGVFYGCNVKSIILGTNVEILPDYLFYGAQFSKNQITGELDFVNIKLPDSVERIGAYALPNISNLQELTIGKNSKLTSVGEYGLSECVNLTVCNLPDSVTEIGNYAFRGCTKLGTDSKNPFKLPKDLLYLGTGAFANCPGITELEIPAGVTDKVTNKTVTPAFVSTFENATGLAQVTFAGAEFTKIGARAFSGCSALEEIAIPNGVTDIMTCAFQNCTSLTDVTIPVTVTFIADDAFSGCGDINFHVVPDSYAEQWLTEKGLLVTRMITITYELNGGTSNPNPAGYEPGDTFTFLPAKRDGYDFAGWFTDAALTKKITSVEGQTEALTLYAAWNIKTYQITYVLYGGENSSGNPDTYTVVDKFTLKNATKEGYTFAGWYSDEAFTKAVTEVKEGTFGDLTFYAKWVGGGVTDAPAASVASGSEISAGTKIFLTTKTPGATIYYTTDETDPTEESEKYVDGIVIEEDTVIKAFATKQGCDPSEVVSFTYTIIDEAEFWGDILPEDREKYGDATEVPDGIWVAGVKESTPFTGAAITFNLRVYDGKKLLKEKTDYTVKYSNNKAAATKDAKKAPTITISSKGNYKGKVTVNFTITPLDIGTLNVEDMVVAKTTKVQKPVPVVMNGKTKLKNKTDFTVDYPDTGYQAAGEYRVVLTGQKNYTGTKIVKLVIKEATSIAKAKILDLPKSLPYDGSAKEPAFRVQVGKTVLEPTSYNVKWSNNTNAGTATVTITGKGDYFGTRTATFKITPLATLKKKDVQLSDTKMSYTGKEIKVGATVTIADGTTLKAGRDYSIKFDKNVNVGNASVVITGQGGYAGTVKTTFKIVAADLGKFDAKLLDEDGKVKEDNIYAYAVGGAKPKVQMVYGGRTLVEGTDYTISYTDNTVYSKTAKPALTIKGKKNFTGTQKVFFVMEQCDLKGFTISATDVQYKKEAGVVATSKVTVTDKAGKTLTQDTDYTVKFEYVNQTRLGDGRLVKENSAVNLTKDVIPAETLIRVKVTGKGNYKSADKNFDYSTIIRLYTKSIAGAKVTIANQYYTGEELQPGLKDITSITLNGVTLLPGQFEIVGYRNNIKKGTGKMIIRGVGEYGGTKEVSFKIVEKPFVLQSVSFNSILEFLF